MPLMYPAAHEKNAISVSGLLTVAFKNHVHDSVPSPRMISFEFSSAYAAPRLTLSTIRMLNKNKDRNLNIM